MSYALMWARIKLLEYSILYPDDSDNRIINGLDDLLSWIYDRLHGVKRIKYSMPTYVVQVDFDLLEEDIIQLKINDMILRQMSERMTRQFEQEIADLLRRK